MQLNVSAVGGLYKILQMYNVLLIYMYIDFIEISRHFYHSFFFIDRMILSLDRLYLMFATKWTHRPFLCLSTHIQTIDNYLSICRFIYCINASFFMRATKDTHRFIYISILKHVFHTSFALIEFEHRLDAIKRTRTTSDMASVKMCNLYAIRKFCEIFDGFWVI